MTPPEDDRERAAPVWVDLPGMPPDLLPYSLAVRHGGLVRTAGIVAMDYATGAPASHTDFAVQVRRAMDNLVAVLEAAGSAPERVLRTALHVADMGRWDEMNRIYVGYFPSPPRPVRTTVQAVLVPPYLFEIGGGARRVTTTAGARREAGGVRLGVGAPDVGPAATPTCSWPWPPRPRTPAGTASSSGTTSSAGRRPDRWPTRWWRSRPRPSRGAASARASWRWPR